MSVEICSWVRMGKYDLIANVYILCSAMCRLRVKVAPLLWSERFRQENLTFREMVFRSPEICVFDLSSEVDCVQQIDAEVVPTVLERRIC